MKVHGKNYADDINIYNDKVVINTLFTIDDDMSIAV